MRGLMGASSKQKLPFMLDELLAAEFAGAVHCNTQGRPDKGCLETKSAWQYLSF
jgi:hypothetical protein